MNPISGFEGLELQIPSLPIVVGRLAVGEVGLGVVEGMEGRMEGRRVIAKSSVPLQGLVSMLLRVFWVCGRVVCGALDLRGFC